MDAFNRVGEASDNVANKNKLNDGMRHLVRNVSRMSQEFLQTSLNSGDDKTLYTEQSLWKSWKRLLSNANAEISGDTFTTYVQQLDHVQKDLGRIIKKGEALYEDLEHLENALRRALAEGTNYAWGERSRRPMPHFRAILKQFNKGGKLWDEISEYNMEGLNDVTEAMLPTSSHKPGDTGISPRTEVEQALQQAYRVLERIGTLVSCLQNRVYEFGCDESLTAKTLILKIKESF